MRPWTLPIVGAVALSLAVPSTADAGLRFGPGALLGAVAGAMFGGFRHTGRHHRHAMHASTSHRGAGRSARHPAPTIAQRPASASQAATDARRSPPNALAERPSASAAARFWPEAGADLADYVLFANGNDRFWTYGYDTMVATAFAGPEGADQRGVRGQPAAGRTSDGTKAPFGAAELCGAPSASADALIERIEQAVVPNTSQRGGLEAMRLRSAAMAQLIAASCPTDPHLDAIGRFTAAADRLDVMLFAVMSMGPMLQQFYDSLDAKQKASLGRALSQARRSGAAGTRS